MQCMKETIDLYLSRDRFLPNMLSGVTANKFEMSVYIYDVYTDL